MRSAALNPANRRAALRSLAGTSAATPLDLLVVGGGVTGAGIAFDAASRGLDVGIVEARDWAWGTSSRSSKLVHGGLRYLEMLDFPLVAEALHERDLLLTRIAPHLVRPLPFLFPFESPLADRAYVGSGLALYDVMAARLGRRRAVPVHRHLGAARAQERFPGLRAEHGAIEYYDAQVDDARLTTALVRSAAGFGAHAASQTRAVGYQHEPDGRISGVVVHDEHTGEEFTVHAHATVLASGVWTPQEQRTAGAGDRGLQVLASKGIHITVPRDRIEAQGDVGVITRTDASVLFIIPWDDCWVIGTTDTPWTEDVSAPVATAADIARVLDSANAILTHPLGPDDVIGTYAGLRPLVQPVQEEGDTTRVSREHAVSQIAPGLSAIAGGKLTTYRVMAEDAVDFALRDRMPGARSRTAELPLLGAEPFELEPQRRQQLAANYGWEEVQLERLLRRYGSLLGEVLELIDEDPALAAPVPGAPHCIAAQAVYAVRAEGALHLIDVLHRRLRLEFEVPDRGTAAAPAIAALIAQDLGWDAHRTEAELIAFKGWVEAGLAAESLGSDAEAVAALADRPIPPDIPGRAYG